MNPSGESKYFAYINYILGLDNLSGVAAILRYPLPGIDDIVEDDVDIDDMVNDEGDT